jgi:peroxiredoxin
VPILLALLVGFAASRLLPPSHPASHYMEPPPQAAPEHPILDVGSPSPDFTLRDAHGEGKITLSQVLNNQPVLLVYYLGYSCPRCVANLHELADRKADFDKLGIQILAVGPDTVANLRDSLDRYADFPFPMLSDSDQKVARALGLVYGEPGAEEMFHGVFVIDTSRKIQFAMKSSHSYDNFETLLSVCRSLHEAAAPASSAP